jgi:hypothetical protein
MSVKLVGRTELAKALGISRKQVDIHRQHGRIQAASQSGRNPLFDLELCKANYAEYKASVTRKRTGGIDKLSAQLRKAKADLEESDLKLARLRDEVLLAADVEQEWTDNRAACLERIRRFPAEVAPSLLGVDDIAQVSDILETEMRRLLDDLATINEVEVDDHEEQDQQAQ